MMITTVFWSLLCPLNVSTAAIMHWAALKYSVHLGLPSEKYYYINEIMYSKYRTRKFRKSRTNLDDFCTKANL